jgi:hypothetical protein
MFAYSFLAMTAYNILKPISKSKFISSFGAETFRTSAYRGRDYRRHHAQLQLGAAKLRARP